METILKSNEISDFEEMTEFLKILSPQEQQRISDFIQGIKFKARLNDTQKAG